MPTVSTSLIPNWKKKFCEKNVGNSPLFEYSGKDGSGYRTDGYMDW